jgi:hypothetical protein
VGGRAGGRLGSRELLSWWVGNKGRGWLGCVAVIMCGDT